MKIKFIVFILILTFLFNGCTKNELHEIKNNPINNKPFILGSVEYVKRVHNIAMKSGNRSALSVVG